MANKLRVVNSFSNALFNRREISLVVEHNKESTPTKDYVRKELSTNFSVPENQIYVFGMKTKFGSHTTDVQAHLYSNFEEMKRIVLPHVLRRITGEEKQKVARRMRKDARKKKAKIFGTMKRNMKKAEKRNKDQ